MSASPTSVDAGPELDAYLAKHVRVCLGIPREAAAVELPRPPKDIVDRLLRLEEYVDGPRDQWGCFEFGAARSFHEGRLWTAEFDEWLEEQRQQLKGRAELEPLWPGGSRFAVCSTHDVDMVSRTVTPTQAARGVRYAAGGLPRGTSDDSAAARSTRVARAFGRAAYYGVARSPATDETLERSMRVERDVGATGSYLFTVPPRRPTPYDCTYNTRDACTFRGRKTSVGAMASALAEDGFDIGLHGSFHSATDATILAEERQRLSDSTGGDVTSIRQHYLRFDIRRTPRVQAESGFAVDSSMGFNRNIGFRAGTSLPFRPFDLERKQATDILEVPMVIQEGPLLRSDGLELGVELAKHTVARMVDRVASSGGAMTVLFHPHALRDRDYFALYRFSLEYARDQGAWLTSLQGLAEWWREREQRLLR